MLHRIRLSSLQGHKPFALLAVALFATCLRPAALNAAIIVNDTWRDGTDNDPASPTYSEMGTDSDADGDIESLWSQGGVGTLNPVGAGGPLRADLTGTGASSASWTTYFTPEGSEINLADGEKIRVTWNFTLSGVGANNTSQNFRFGVVDSASKVAADGSLPSTTYLGYAIWGNMGGTLGNNGPFQLRERTLLTNGNFLNTTGDFNTVLGNGATTGATGYAAATPYSMVWEMTRNGTGLDLDVRITGGSLDNDGEARVTVNDPSPVSFKFDTFGIRPSGETSTAMIFDTSLFRVEYIVPEPVSATLFGFGSLVFATVFGRRRTR